MAQRRTAFAGFYGELYPDDTLQTAYWAVSRLALEVVGLFDENCYPAYFEDTDYIRRMHLLGLQEYRVPGWETTPLLHIGGGSRLVTDTGLHAPEHAADIHAFMKGSTAIIRRAFWTDYATAKYGHIPANDFSIRVDPNVRGGTPLDAFVINERRRCTIEQLEQRLIDKVRANPLIPDVEMAAMIWEAETAPGNPIHRRINGAKYYRNGTSLRLLTDCAVLMGGGGARFG
ncbi:hypothetical protein NESM_000936500 [Novymonas esmeraldas]|uniref:Uncharacterized protein n=1 Tax=Novymonas esmeraldas TaxID=1808958 RepID=A0AAW0F2Z5_9TRYP